jgi:predicted nuclease with TOPRIM domain
LGAIASEEEAEIVYKFDAGLTDNFPNREVFDRALEATFTAGLKFTDIEDAKKTYLQREFDRSIGRMAGAASLSNESVLKTIAPLIPDYRKTQLERDSLKEELEANSAKIAQLQDEKRTLESELNQQTSRLSRLESTNASLQEQVKGSASEALQLDKDLQDAKRKIQRYEEQIAGIQKSLNLEADAKRDLTRNNEELAERILGLQKDLANQQAETKRLAGELEDKEKRIKKLNGTIGTLTSNKDSLGRQYVQLKDEKEKLDDFALAVDALEARVVEEKTEGGRYYGKADILLENVRLGSLEWNFPSYLSHNQTDSGKATFYAESIDFVKVTPEERHILQTLGKKLKVGMDLDVLGSTMRASSEDGSEPREIGERESATWNWQIFNSGAEDVPFLISAHLINSYSRQIPLFKTGHTVVTSNPVRRMRSYLQPIPLIAGIVLGFLLFGIVGIFRRPKARKPPPARQSPKEPAKPETHVTEKKL